MSSITFVTWDGAGNLGPTLAVASELRSRSHRVDVLGHDSTADTIASAGVDFHRFPTGSQWSADRPSNPLQMLAMFGDQGLGADVLDHIGRHGADVVVVDCLLFGVMGTLRRAGVPYVALEHLCDGYLRRAARGPLGVALRLQRIPPLRLLEAAVDRITLTIPELDHGHGDVSHVGPVVRGTASRATEPAVLISLSTYGYAGMHGVWQRVLDAIDDLPARVVVTTGPRIDPADLRIPAHVEVHRWLDHGAVLPEMSAVVCHGGHGTTVAALAHGLPVLAIPLDAKTDQPYLGDSLERLGVGRKLSKRAKPAAIRTALDSLLADGPHRANAARLADSIAAHDGRSGAASLIESMLPRANTSAHPPNDFLPHG